MNISLKALLIGLSAATLLACGSNGGEDTQTIECGDDTVANEETQECEPIAFECGDDEVHDAVLGRCVRDGQSYCGEGTELDEQRGTCVAEASLVCGEDTVEDEGECVMGPEKSCGAGTVVHDHECVPSDEVCGEGTEHVAGDDACRPVDGVCGEGTAFDVADRICVPTSTLSCGVGTIADDDHFCIPTRKFYEDLAADPDLDMTGDDSTAQIPLGAPGESFVFTGNIGAPQLVDDEYIQDEDIYHLDAEAGQWLRITIYSLGLPEPFFLFNEQVDDDPFYRLSDLGAGIETTREIVIQDDSSFELVVANLPQFMETSPPAGGDDWIYVGVVETMVAPDPSPIDLSEEMSGDIRHLSHNFYGFQGADAIESMALITHLVPNHAESQLQIWSEEMTLHQSFDLDDGVYSFDAPGDTFYLLFDHVQAVGDSLTYSMSLQEGTSLGAGEQYTTDVDLAAGEYVRLFQDNLDNAPLSAIISDDSGVLVEAQELAVSNASADPVALFWYAHESWAADFDTVTIEVENTSAQDLAFVSIDHDVHSASDVPSFTGDDIDFSYDEALPRGQRHYLNLEIDAPEDLVRIALSGTSREGRLTLWSKQSGELEEVADGRNAIVFDDEPGPTRYLLTVDALETMSSGFALDFEQTNILEFSETSSPQADIPDNSPSGVNDIIQIGGCISISEIDMDIEVSHAWRGDLIVRLTNPGGDTRTLKARPGSGVFGDSAPDIIGNFNATLDPVAGEPATSEAEPISNFVGADGNGEWTLNVSDNAGGSVGTLNSWTLNLTCDG